MLRFADAGTTNEERIVKPALVVVDMIKDNVYSEKHLKVAAEAREIVPSLKRFVDFAHGERIPVIYANDSFLKGDFIFQGKMKEHALRRTEGVQVIDELKPDARDYVIEKLRFSAFHKTDLDQMLRIMGVDTVLVAGITLQWCVLLTAADAVANDFHTVILEDLTACHKKEVKNRVVDLYGNSPLAPLFRIVQSDAFIEEYKQRKR
jgi:nicotinamidase-related amidase